MLNFKKVLTGGVSNLDMKEQSDWPELSAANQVNLNSKKSENNCLVFDKDSMCNNTSVASTSKSLPQDFPKLMDSFNNTDKRIKMGHILLHNEESSSVSHINGNVTKKSNYFKHKKQRKTPSKDPISIDLSMMLKVSLSLAERKRRHKRIQFSRKRNLRLREQLFMIATGNQLDSDCPIRYKGKKRPHKRRKQTAIKRGFLLASEKNKRTLTGSAYFTKRMKSLRQLILSGISKGQDVEDLVVNLDKLEIAADTENVHVDSELLPLDNMETAKCMMHSRKFRPYCDHILKDSLKNKSKDLITTLRRFQDKQHIKDPIGSRSKRRYVCGCHEAKKFLRLDSAKLLFIANNLAIDNGMPPIMEEILYMAKELGLPIIYAGSASDLGYWTLKKRKISIITVLNYEGAETLVKEMLEELTTTKNDYQTLLQKINLLLQEKGKGKPTTNLLQQDDWFREVEEQIGANIISKLTS